MLSAKKYLLIIMVLAGMSDLSSQNVFQPKPVDYNLKGILYDFETVFEGRIHTQGFALSFRKGRLRSYYRTTYQNFEIGYVKDGRERRTNRNLSVAGFKVSSPFTYGKQNDFFTLRYSYGEKRYLSEKTRRKGLAVGVIYEGGLTLGLLKPYSLKFIRIDEDNPTLRTVETLLYSDEYRDDFLNERIIYGGDSFFSGWGSITPKIGLHGKLGMHWALGAFESGVRAAEAGVMFDIFPSDVPLLIEQEGIENSFYYFKFYVSFQFGHRKRIGQE